MPNAENCTLAELQTAAGAAPTQKTFFRFLALRLLLLGKVSKADVCVALSLKLNTLNGWIRRFNA
ncbi:MAG: hypothetical protein WCI73_06870 [Phycisphaerae bacterium]